MFSGIYFHEISNLLRNYFYYFHILLHSYSMNEQKQELEEAIKKVSEYC